MFLFFTTYLLTLPALFLILSLGVLFSMGDMDSWAVFTGILSGVVAFFMFDFTILQVFIFATLYFLAGVAWSFWRYKRYAENRIEIFNHSSLHLSRERERERLIEDLKIENMTGKITGWILSWPFSMIENVVGDVIRLVRNMVTNLLKNVYNSIHASVIKNLKSIN